MEKKTIVRPGRVAQEKKVMQLPVSGLKVGMYVRELDRPWLETPFILQGFPIRSVDEIEEIAKHCEWVIVEVGEDVWQPAQERAVLAGRSTRAMPVPSPAARRAELNNAQNIHTNARALTRSFMDDVRLGRGIDIKAVKATVSECVRSILRDPDAMQWMSKLRSKDEYTSEHSLNVGLLAIAFGRSGACDQHELPSSPPAQGDDHPRRAQTILSGIHSESGEKRRRGRRLATHQERTAKRNARHSRGKLRGKRPAARLARFQDFERIGKFARIQRDPFLSGLLAVELPPFIVQNLLSIVFNLTQLLDHFGLEQILGTELDTHFVTRRSDAAPDHDAAAAIVRPDERNAQLNGRADFDGLIDGAGKTAIADIAQR